MLLLGRLRVNDPRKLFIDERCRGMCVYCGAKPTTRDHCPSKALLDEPYPSNLPLVAACERCNQKFSKDEQYMACVVECALCGSVNPAEVERPNIRILVEVPRLAEQIRSTMTLDERGGKVWMADMAWSRSVVLKRARGHIDYELSDDNPAVLEVESPILMSEERREFFENPESGPFALWPEIGSRAFVRLATGGDMASGGWIEVQTGRYDTRWVKSAEPPTSSSASIWAAE